MSTATRCLDFFSEPCSEDTKGDGEAVEQVIWKEEKCVDYQEPEIHFKLNAFSFQNEAIKTWEHR